MAPAEAKDRRPPWVARCSRTSWALLVADDSIYDGNKTTNYFVNYDDRAVFSAVRGRYLPRPVPDSAVQVPP